ncbi:heparanase-like [Orbicella faveolata]|nr:heparanase-like [Orbicella faveolata]
MKAVESSLPQFFVPQALDLLHRSLDKADEVLDQVAPNLPRWLGETANVAGGGAKGLSDRFVSGFLWLNKLGLAAQHGYKVVIRQSMFRGEYSLLGQDLEPNPDYWLAVLHKRLFGTKVLGIDRGNHRPELVRIFAHCTKTG